MRSLSNMSGVILFRQLILENQILYHDAHLLLASPYVIQIVTYWFKSYVEDTYHKVKKKFTFSYNSAAKKRHTAKAKLYDKGR